MPRSARTWFIATALIATSLAAAGYFRGDVVAVRAITMGVGLSLVTMVASAVTVRTFKRRDSPLHRMLIETSVRMAIPLGFLSAVAIARRDLLSEAFLLYFLPFQFLTIYAGTVGAVRQVKVSDNGQSEKEI